MKLHNYEWTTIGLMGGFFGAVIAGPETIHTGFQHLESILPSLEKIIQPVSYFYSEIARVERELGESASANFMDKRFFRVASSTPFGIVGAMLGYIADRIESYKTK